MNLRKNRTIKNNNSVMNARCACESKEDKRGKKNVKERIQSRYLEKYKLLPIYWQRNHKSLQSCRMYRAES